MRTVLLVALALGVAFSGCTMKGEGSTHDVSAKDNQFEPNSLSVKQNEMIAVKNDGQVDHTVTIHKGGDPVTTTKKDTNIAPGTSTDYKFEETGTFHVYCKYHSGGSAGTFGTGMVLTVTVTA